MPIHASRPLLLADAAWRLGARPVTLLLLHRMRVALGRPQRALPDGRPAVAPFLPESALPPPAVDGTAVLHAVAALPPPTHGRFDPAAHALALDLFAPGDVRPVWEANRLAEIPLLAMAQRLDPGGGHGAQAEARLGAWCASNPPFRGPNWACGQEAALRALHLGLGHALAGGGAVPAGLRALLRAHARRIAATRAYAAAQDNNHAISEPAGAFACALLLGEDPAPHAAALAAAVARLVEPAGGFAPVSTGYHRLLLDVLAVAEWLRRFHGAPPFPAPLPARAAAATRWLLRLHDPATGALPRLGHADGSRFADLSLGGAADARGSLERAARLFLGASAEHRGDPGCAWLDLPVPGAVAAGEARWCAAGSRGWARDGARAVLRTGPLRFRPGQSDLLHLDLWDGAVNLLRDGGTLSYNPAPAQRAAAAALEDAGGHDAVVFDDREPMPRAGRFLRARWPATGLLPEGAWSRDRRGNRHARSLSGEGRCWIVTDTLSGPFRSAALRWRLPPAEWRSTGSGVASALGRVSVAADAPVELSLALGQEAPRYGELREVPVLCARVARPATRLVTTIELP
ncbi:heparinase II/III family protein [Roseomonas sp. BN140053]|uniref:heparinase II/III domain-containing protein n=1 Tax=Roseomonas sp. BN140053 TaxID=3391898 RepID=UPI0039E76D2A